MREQLKNLPFHINCLTHDMVRFLDHAFSTVSHQGATLAETFGLGKPEPEVEQKKFTVPPPPKPVALKELPKE